MTKRELMGALIAIIYLVTPLPPSTAKKAQQHEVHGDQVFQQHCASCHAGGGNNVNPKHPVAGSKELSSLATFKSYLSQPPGHMPYYQDIVEDPATLQALYKYCKTLKKESIKQVSSKQRSQAAPGKLADAR